MTPCPFPMERPVLPLSEGERATITLWLVSEGDAVQDGQALVRYSVEGNPRVLVARTGGTLARILAKQGAEVGGGEGVCEVEACPHDELFSGICASCGVDVEELERLQPRRNTDDGDSAGSMGAPAAGAQHQFGMFGSRAHPELKTRFRPRSPRTAHLPRCEHRGLHGTPSLHKSCSGEHGLHCEYSFYASCALPGEMPSIHKRNHRNSPLPLCCAVCRCPPPAEPPAPLSGPLLCRRGLTCDQGSAISENGCNRGRSAGALEEQQKDRVSSLLKR